MTLTRRALPGIATLLLAGCASAEPDYFRLSALPPAAPAAPGRAPEVIELRRPGLARYLDRSEIVRGGEGARVDVLSGQRWAEPLAEMLARVLAENLTLRLPGRTVFAESSALSLQAPLRAEADILRFEGGADGQVVLQAQLALRPERGEARRGQAFQTRIPIQGTGTPALVAAMDRALAAMAEALAEMIRQG